MARTSGQELLDKVKGLQNGIYAGGNNNSVGNWSVNGEGTWVNQDDVGSITLCGRSRVAGSSFAMVLGGPQENHVNNLYSIALHKYVHYNVHLSVIFPSFHHV